MSSAIPLASKEVSDCVFQRIMGPSCKTIWALLKSCFCCCPRDGRNNIRVYSYALSSSRKKLQLEQKKKETAPSSHRTVAAGMNEEKEFRGGFCGGMWPSRSECTTLPERKKLRHLSNLNPAFPSIPQTCTKFQVQEWNKTRAIKSP